MNKAKLAAGALVIAAGAALLLAQQLSLVSLRDDNRFLHHEMALLQAENGHLSNAVVRASRSLPEDQARELLRLRAEVAMLRQRSAGFGSLREQNQKLQTELAQAQTGKSKEDQLAEERRAATIETLKEIGSAMTVFASNRNTRLATNYEQLYTQLGRTNVIGGISTEGIEFVNLEQLDRSLSNQYVFREREPRQLPSGSWEWLYGTPDGSVMALTSEDGDFDDFESEDILPPDDEDDSGD